MNKNIIDETKKCVLMAKIGKVMMKDGLPIFIFSVLSPFDFEGPIIEITTSSIVVVGGILKLVSSKEIENIKERIEIEESEEVKTQVRKLINRIDKK